MVYRSMSRSQTLAHCTGCSALRSSATGKGAPCTFCSRHTLTPSCTATTSVTSSPCPHPWTLKSTSPVSKHHHPQPSLWPCTTCHTTRLSVHLTGPLSQHALTSCSPLHMSHASQQTL